MPHTDSCKRCLPELNMGADLSLIIAQMVNLVAIRSGLLKEVADN